MTPNWTAIATLDSIPDPGCARYSLTVDQRAVELFALRSGSALRAYLNRCPHQGLNLDWQPGRFLDATARFIVCANHGALFRLDDGVCVAGPCIGAALSAVAVRSRTGIVEVEVGTL